MEKLRQGRGPQDLPEVPWLWVQRSLQDSRLSAWHNLSSLQKNGIDLKSLVSRVRNSHYARWNRKRQLLRVSSPRAAGSSGAFPLSGKLLTSCNVRTRGTLHPAPNLSRERTCQLLAFAFALTQSFCNPCVPLEIWLNAVQTPIAQ